MNKRCCTWVDCPAGATHSQNDRNGIPWADLCHEHNICLAEAIAAGVKPMLAAWVKAQGGAKAATQRMELPIRAMAKELAALHRVQA